MDQSSWPGGDAVLRHRLEDAIARYCPSWLNDSLDDIVQVAWLRLRAAGEKNERNLDPGASLVSRVAYCATVDEIRRRRRRREVSMESALEPPAGRQQDQTAQVRAREIGRTIRQCLGCLLPNRCLAVTLYLQGHTAVETGRILGWSLRKTENLIFRGMADLRRCLTDKGVTP